MTMDSFLFVHVLKYSSIEVFSNDQQATLFYGMLYIDHDDDWASLCLFTVHAQGQLTDMDLVYEYRYCVNRQTFEVRIKLTLYLQENRDLLSVS